MKISGIIFDKDGTLLDFNEFWIPAAQCVIRVENIFGYGD